mmetsp:Transcript_8902/g.29289  ORF Transcript_8902/g.29289 Transcript_8902/m.29289 type:complete len:422 (+) Transcript_8902:1806-3071(+)
MDDDEVRLINLVEVLAEEDDHEHVDEIPEHATSYWKEEHIRQWFSTLGAARGQPHPDRDMIRRGLGREDLKLVDEFGELHDPLWVPREISKRDWEDAIMCVKNGSISNRFIVTIYEHMCHNADSDAVRVESLNAIVYALHKCSSENTQVFIGMLLTILCNGDARPLELSPAPSPSSPLVLLFGYGGSTHAELKVWKEMWAKIGAQTAALTTPWAEFIAKERREAVFAAWTAAADEGRPVIAHCLSNSGTGLFIDVLKGRGEHPPLSGIILECAAMVECDLSESGDVRQSIENQLLALLKPLPIMDKIGGEIRNLLKRTVHGRTLEATYFADTFRWESKLEWFQQNFPSGCPRLFVYTDPDTVVPADRIESFISGLSDGGTGALTTVKKFSPGPPHVQIIIDKTTREEYASTIQSFFTACCG